MKIVAIGIFFLFLGMNFAPALGQIIEKQPTSVSDDKWWYVGGNGPGNFSVIQDAVDNASDGDTIFVYHGIYNQSWTSYQIVDIFKSITLLGENKTSTILNGSRQWDVIRVMTDDVHISGFTIQNSGVGQVPGDGIHIYEPTGMHQLQNITVSDTILCHDNIGITIYECNNSKFSNNIFNEDDIACDVKGSTNCQINNSLFTNNTIGIHLYLEQGIKITQNEFQGNGKGIYCETCKDIIINSNNFIHNTIQATFLKYTRYIIGAIKLIPYKQQWNDNYWGDWNKTRPRPIVGVYLIDLLPPIIPLFLPIYIPSVEFDRRPAQEPHVIQ
jgi:parallel beta-helix repeat protein